MGPSDSSAWQTVFLAFSSPSKNWWDYFSSSYPVLEQPQLVRKATNHTEGLVQLLQSWTKTYCSIQSLNDSAAKFLASLWWAYANWNSQGLETCPHLCSFQRVNDKISLAHPLRFQLPTSGNGKCLTNLIIMCCCLMMMWNKAVYVVFFGEGSLTMWKC